MPPKNGLGLAAVIDRRLEFGHFGEPGANPEGIESFRPGLRASRYPGSTRQWIINSERVESIPRIWIRGNPDPLL